MSEFRKRPGVDMQNFEHESTDEDDTHLHHRARNPLINRPPPPPKTTIAAVLLLVLGSIFLVLGLAIYLSGRIYSSDKGISFLALGSLMFIPGSYASWILFGAWRGWDGYHYSMVPSYDD